MGVLKTAGLALGALALATTGVIVARTLTFGDTGPASDTVELPDPPAFDLDAATAHLGDAIRIKTITTVTGDPREGRDQPWIDFQDFLEATYADVLGKTTLEVVGGYTLVYTWKGSDPGLDPLILMAHQDVVPINMGTVDDWEHGPFGGVVADGFVWGRGAIDDKGSLVSIMEAAQALARSGWTPKRTIIFQFGHDEEVAGTGAVAAFEHHKANGVKPFLILDEGMAAIEKFPITGKPVALIGVAEKGYQSLVLTAQTVGGHSSTPPRESGEVRIARAIVALEENQMPAHLGAPFSDTVAAVGGDLPFMTRMALANTWAFGGQIKSQAEKDSMLNAILRTTTAPTMMSGSIKDNVLPQRAQAVVNFRIHPQDTLEDLLEHVRKTTAHVEGLEVTLYDEMGGIGSPASPVSSTDGEGWAALSAVAQSVGDGAPVAPMLVLGATDARFATAIADQQIYRFTPAFYSQVEASLPHGTNERVSVANVDRMIRGYARLMMLVSGDAA